MSLARQDLHADTDAVERFSFSQDFLFEGLDHSRSAKISGAFTESPDTRQNDSLRGRQVFRTTGNAHVGGNHIQRIPHRMQITHAIINNCNHFASWPAAPTHFGAGAPAALSQES